MFGYVRPCKSELRCKDFDLYQSAYCGLCRCLRQNYGLLAPLILNYDFTFLALLLWDPEEDFTVHCEHCTVNPLKKRLMCSDSAALRQAAAESVILAWWKFRDDATDKGPIKRIPSEALSILFRHAYKKAAGNCPAFDTNVKENLSRLAELEQNCCDSLDQTADCFASLLQGAVSDIGPQGRVLSQILYHLGRWIYLADARDDLTDDRENGNYNAIISCFGPEGNDKILEITMNGSLSLACDAFELGDFGCRTSLIENILYLGLPIVQKSILNGEWTQLKNQGIRRGGR